MNNHDSRTIIKNIIQGVVITEPQSVITTVRNHLCRSFSTNTKIEKNFEHHSRIKEEQKQFLIEFIEANNLWLAEKISEERYLTEGGEAKIYFGNDNKSVVKFNDAIYYNTWLDFFNSLLIHNTLFELTAYELLGFKKANDDLYAVLKQPFIVSDSAVDLKDVKEILEFNGFKNTKRNDYYNAELGIILEDMHDENVIVNSNMLFFIDTVFYIHIVD